jgi:polyferredoxin
MDAVGQSRGLIRYASEKMIAEGQKMKFNLRTAAYSLVLVILLGAVTFSFLARKPIEATVLRAPGMLYQEPEPGKFSNLYNIKLVNKTNEDLPVQIRMVQPMGEIKIIGNDILVKKESVGESVFFIILDKSVVTSDKVPVRVGIFSGNKEIEVVKATFVGPGERK